MTRLFMLFSIFVLPTIAIACSCSNFWGPLTIKDYNETAIIFSGRAIKVTIIKNETDDKQRQIDFEIDELFKGELIEKTIKLYTSLSDASCGLFVNENEEWIIWAYLQDNVITTNLCTRSSKKERVTDRDLKSLRYYKSNPTTTEWRNEAGVVIAKGKLKDNKPSGFWRYFYREDFIESEGSYVNGEKDGKWIVFLDPDGIVKRLRYDKVIPDDSMPDLEQFKNRVREIQHYKGGIRDGEFIFHSYWSIDKPDRIVNYKNGRFEGKSVGYYNDGLLKYEQNYKEGKLDGYERFFHPNGQLKQVGRFVNGQATGEFKVFNEEGELIKSTINKRPD